MPSLRCARIGRALIRGASRVYPGGIAAHALSATPIGLRARALRHDVGPTLPMNAGHGRRDRHGPAPSRAEYRAQSATNHVDRDFAVGFNNNGDAPQMTCSRVRVRKPSNLPGSAMPADGSPAAYTSGVRPPPFPANVAQW